MAVKYHQPKPDKIYAWVKKHFPNFKSRKNRTELRINNPFDGDTGFNFNISLLKGVCFDWRGNDWAPLTKNHKRNVSFYQFVQLYKGVSFYQAVSDVGGTITLTRIEQEEVKEKPKELISLPTPSYPILSSEIPKVASVARSYLLGRGFTDYIIGKYNFMHSGTDIVVPYYEYNELVFWQTRNNINKRFEFPAESSGYKKSDYLYGFDNIEPAQQVIITEAIFCAVSIDHQSGATGGDSISQKQIRKIKVLMPDEVVLAVDNDVPGIKSILENGNKLLADGLKVKFVIPPKIQYKPNEFTKDWNDLLKNKIYDPKQIRDYIRDNTKELSIREKFNISGMLRS